MGAHEGREAHVQQAALERIPLLCGVWQLCVAVMGVSACKWGGVAVGGLCATSACVTTRSSGGGCEMWRKEKRS
eukprot:CAMPEP_0202893046 /NCGR_PEP_ID=MMETSP1392-20130828/2692_1 /ASSEMBLY_ACC=CAM_ASM_000868 /TAXON_ID=225041 /ORGANISM="Chlamydomonas chlamydogama, Strain SAG 11-48b" /LENGTH=73 /DNA_ID=CAMNT_0049577229 /DNA_START=282 /DNA_END=503 /DNA_ORIENTATION=+